MPLSFTQVHIGALRILPSGIIRLLTCRCQPNPAATPRPDVLGDVLACGEGSEPGPMIPGRAWMAIALTVGVLWTVATHISFTLCPPD